MTSLRATRGGRAAGGGAGRADLVDEEDLGSHVDAHAGDGAHSGVHSCGGDTWHRGDIAASGGDPPLPPGAHPDAPRPHTPIIFPRPTPRVQTSPRPCSASPQAPAAARTTDPPHPRRPAGEPGGDARRLLPLRGASPCASPPLVSTAMAMPAPAIRSRSSSAAAIAALPGTGVPPRAPAGRAPSEATPPHLWPRPPGGAAPSRGSAPPRCAAPLCLAGTDSRTRVRCFCDAHTR